MRYKTVKDKSNLVSFNAWSGTDYSKDITGFNNSPESSTEWSYNGDRSLKLNRFSESYAAYTTSYSIDLLKSNYLFTCRIYAPNTNGQIILLSDEGNVSVNFTSNKNVQLITLSITNQSISRIRFVNWTSNTSVFIDEISLINNL